MTLPSPTRRNPIWFSLQMIFRVIFAVWFRYHAKGHERIPDEGGGLIVSNHESHLDPLIVGMPFRRPISYVVRESLWNVPLLGRIIKYNYTIPISRTSPGAASIRTACEYLDYGFLMGVFPEGTRSPDGVVRKFRPGFVTLAKRTGVPVYPCGIAGSQRAMPRGSWFIRPRKIVVVFGEPFSVDEIAALIEKGEEKQLTQLAKERVIACQAEAESLIRGGRTT
jgi:1-acyl-sn-glycerol-3-phosphate acyltransferase